MLTGFIFPFVWMSGVTFLIDETTIHVKGRQADKKTGCAIFQKRYTYQIFMCNDPLPKKYLDKVMLPRCARVMALFILLRKNTINAQCILSSTWPPFSWKRTKTNKLLTRGVIRKGMKGIPPCVT